MSAACLHDGYKDLPYQVSTTAGGGGFNTENLIVDQTSTGFEWESTLFLIDNFSLHASLGYIDVDVDEQQGVKPVAPLTPELTWLVEPGIDCSTGRWCGSVYAPRLLVPRRHVRRAEFGPWPFDSHRRSFADERRYRLSLRRRHVHRAVYGRNITDERYDNARLNTGDYVLRILSNDPSEFGLRLVKSF